MRQWHVDPAMMCRKHLLGEHVEHHMFVASIIKGRSINGYIKDGLIEVHTLFERHDELVKEMIRRGYNHASPLSYVRLYKSGKVNRDSNLVELARRCEACRERINK